MHPINSVKGAITTGVVLAIIIGVLLVLWAGNSATFHPVRTDRWVGSGDARMRDDTERRGHRPRGIPETVDDEGQDRTSPERGIVGILLCPIRIRRVQQTADRRRKSVQIAEILKRAGNCC